MHSVRRKGARGTCWCLQIAVEVHVDLHAVVSLDVLTFTDETMYESSAILGGVVG